MKTRAWFFLIAAGMILSGVATRACAQDEPPAQSTAGQASDPTGDANAKKARAVLDAMVKALGGDQWLALSNVYIEGRVSGYYQGKPTGMIMNYRQWRMTNGDERVELGKKHDDIEIFTAGNCWEATYKGKKALPKDVCEDYQRRRAHSIDVAVRQWLQNPKTILIDEGQTLSERHLTDQVTLISAENESITIQVDADTHLPRSRTFQWRDPLYKDKNEEREEYDDYHPVDGIPTPYSVTRFHNGDQTSQRYVFKGGYNVLLPPDMLNADAAAAAVKK
ncbi:hypothetical protein [Silvibacterium dinghuense]|uniref:Outer membrane lipoprotein-sorting protein n=1 Tax=Silvibacterium dinghuense TaxID=1560006 RepID=A0A4Q1SI17_9BACT|nr:hypothetical protein [Silvibacterium dinghuense]RXS97027.1 hypothetical protein ESZ00_03610 [Silvibacterium dinghuense]GGG95607.1 hypothetical protein GCM10011586_08340 [Silvibacterium dinghuense]